VCAHGGAELTLVAKLGRHVIDELRIQ
jgi:hypothetical protein